MDQNAIYICISWYSKICWFQMKKWWCQQKSKDLSRDSYIFRFSLGKFSKFNHCWICVIDFREGSFFVLLHPWAALKKSILNKVKDSQNFFIKSLLRHTSDLHLNYDIVDFVKLNVICSPIFIVNQFSRLFLHSWIFLDLHE